MVSWVGSMMSLAERPKKLCVWTGPPNMLNTELSTISYSSGVNEMADIGLGWCSLKAESQYLIDTIQSNIVHLLTLAPLTWLCPTHTRVLGRTIVGIARIQQLPLKCQTLLGRSEYVLGIPPKFGPL